MKMYLLILMMGLLFLGSCKTGEAQMTNSESFEECLPDEFKSDLQFLLKSFDGILERKYHGRIDHFIEALLRRLYPSATDFTSEDLALGKRLRLNGFYDNIYTRTEVVYTEGDIQPPRTAGDENDERRMTLKVDKNKPYLECLLGSSNKGDFVKSIVGYYNELDEVSPYVIGEDILKIKDTAEYKSKMVKTIVAVEIYYMMLDAVSKNKE